MEEDDIHLIGLVAKAARTPNKAGSRGRHSPLYEAMWRNYDTLVPELSAPRMPNWDAVALEFSKAGLLDGLGNPPTGALTRNTWWKIQRDKAAGPKVRKKTGRPPKAQPVAPVPTAPAPTRPTLQIWPSIKVREVELSFSGRGPTQCCVHGVATWLR